MCCMGAAEQRKKLHDFIDGLSDTDVNRLLEKVRLTPAEMEAVLRDAARATAIRESAARMIATHDSTLRKLAK